MNEETKNNIAWLDRPVTKAFPLFSREKLILAVIIILALLSRFLLIGSRVMSHDEINHVSPAYNLYQGNGYAHNPVTHGPFQFHMLALSYFLFGDSDYTSRVPAALFSFAAVLFVIYAFRRYLGRFGRILGGLFFLVSPYILFYGRYTRNEAFIELFAVMTFYAFFRYYEKRDNTSLYILAVTTALQFTTKEVAYIYTAQLLLFCGFMFLKEIWNMPWKEIKQRSNAFMLLLAAILFALIGLLVSKLLPAADGGLGIPALAFMAVSAGILIAMIVYTVRALSWKTIRTSPAFNLIVFLGALILPQLAAFPVSLLGWNPLDYSSQGILRTGIVLVICLVLSFAIGIWWNRKVFLKSAAAFYLIFIFFYTTVFTNMQGFFTGIIGSLGYWLSQQSVQRGGQPIYYYLIQVPLYEYAALAGTVIAVIIACKKHLWWSVPGDALSASNEEAEVTEDAATDSESAAVSENVMPEAEAAASDADAAAEDEVSATAEAPAPKTKVPVILFLLYWSLTSFAAYSVAGEKMPWLTVHIAIPLALCAAWGLGYLCETAPWKKITNREGLFGLLGMVMTVFGVCGLVGAFNAYPQPFGGKDLEHLRATFRLVTVLVFLVFGLVLMIKNWRNQTKHEVWKMLTLCFMLVLTVLQTRAAFVSSFINYDYANELLVYAHCAPGVKTAVDIIEDIAERTGAGKNLSVAYDNDANYPFWWYLREYTNKNYFGEDNPTRNLRNYDIIVANSSKDGRLEPIVKDNYYRYEFTRMWWPNQDYKNWTWDSFKNFFTNPRLRSAIFKIWLDRDYSYYAAVSARTGFTAEDWSPSSNIVMYVRKDIMNRMFLLSEGIIAGSDAASYSSDLEEERFTQLQPDLTFGSSGIEPGQFTKPRNLALSPDGSRVYVLDSGAGRVQYFDAAGNYLGQWNSANGQLFSELWGIAVGADGSVYLADTWNNRVVKCDADGEFITQWNSNDPSGSSFYGPRSIAVSSDGSTVYVCDTGYKRIMVYDNMGNFIRSFGVSGMGMGELDEPVGITLLDDEHLAVADTWNQRVQVFDLSAGAANVSLVFEVNAWYTLSLDNKPYIASDGTSIYLTDPEGNLVHQYDMSGQLIRTWNGNGGDIDNYSLPTGITVGPDGAVWVVDTENCRVNRFVIPAE